METVLKERQESTTDSQPSSDGSDTDGSSVERSTIELPVDTEFQLSVPPSATAEETAALASCLGAHLRDEQLAAQAASQPEYVDGWSLAGRYGCRSATELPRVEPGEEWKMAARVGRGR